MLVVVAMRDIAVFGRMHRQLDELAQSGPHGHGQQERDQTDKHDVQPKGAPGWCQTRFRHTAKFHRT
jgi:hypothetical protein